MYVPSSCKSENSRCTTGLVWPEQVSGTERVGGAAPAVALLLLLLALLEEAGTKAAAVGEMDWLVPAIVRSHWRMMPEYLCEQPMQRRPDAIEVVLGQLQH